MAQTKSTAQLRIVCQVNFDRGVRLIQLVPSGGGRRVVYGTDDGVYLSDLRDPNRDPVKVLGLLDVSQVDVLEEYQLLIVLSGQSCRVLHHSCT